MGTFLSFKEWFQANITKLHWYEVTVKQIAFAAFEAGAAYQRDEDLAQKTNRLTVKQQRLNKRDSNGGGMDDQGCKQDNVDPETIRDAERFQWLIERGVAWRGCYNVTWQEGEWLYAFLNARGQIDDAMRKDNK